MLRLCRRSLTLWSVNGSATSETNLCRASNRRRRRSAHCSAPRSRNGGLSSKRPASKLSELSCGVRSTSASGRFVAKLIAALRTRSTLLGSNQASRQHAAETARIEAIEVARHCDDLGAALRRDAGRELACEARLLLLVGERLGR